jgi:hypothetical protein
MAWCYWPMAPKQPCRRTASHPAATPTASILAQWIQQPIRACPQGRLLTLATLSTVQAPQASLEEIGPGIAVQKTQDMRHGECKEHNGPSWERIVPWGRG